MKRVGLASCALAALALASGTTLAGSTALAATGAPAVHLAKPTRLLFHGLDNGRGYFEQAPLTGDGPAEKLFRYDAEPFSAVATNRQIVWVTEPDQLTNTRIVLANDDGTGRHVLVPHASYAQDLVLAGQYVYWGSTHWIGRVRLDGAQLTRHFRHIPIERGGGTEDGMTTDGRSLYFTQCVAGRIGSVPIAGAEASANITWLVVDPHNGSFCPQALAYGDKHLFYAVDSGIGRVDADGSSRDDTWQDMPVADQPGDLVADDDYLYWDTCTGPGCSSSHVARMTTSGKDLTFGLYDHVDQGLALAP